MAWSILLLGVPQILREGESVQVARRKNRALLYYLAAHSKPLTRDQVLALFFIDHERAAARQILRTMLHDLRAQMGDALLVQGDTLALAPETFVDVRDFEAALRVSEGRLNEGERGVQEQARRFDETSLQLYRGDFLEGFELADVPEFEDWIARERERYRAMVIRGWMRVAAELEAEGEYARALEALNHALAFDALNEEAQRDALRVQYLNGDRTGAIRRFEQLQKGLDQELGVPPMAETRAVYDAIITDTLEREVATVAGRATGRRTTDGKGKGGKAFRVTAGAGPRLPFAGRELELQAVQDAASSGKMIWLEGEPGIGKTRLAEEYCTRYASDEALVLRGTAHELETSLPYQPLIDALRGYFSQGGKDELRAHASLAPVWLAELVRLVPELTNAFPDVPPAPSSADEARVWEGLHQVLKTLARTRRVILFLDDAHWADTATIGFLNYLARHTNTPALTILLTARALAPASRAARLLETLTRQDQIVRVVLDVLSPVEVREIAEQINPLQTEVLTRWLMEKGEGNPFFVNELLRYAYHNGLLRENGALDASVLGDGSLLPPTVQSLIATRLTRLDESARRVLYVVAAIGREFDFGLVARAAGMPEEQVLDALDALRGAGLIVARQGGLTFDHSLTMHVARQEMGETRLRFLHRRVAEALEQIHHAHPDAVAGLVAHHLAEANAIDRAAPFARRAGDYAGRLAAWSDAIAFYELALRGETDEGARARIFVGLGDAQFHLADFSRATESYRTGLALARNRRDFAVMEQALLALTQSLFPQARYGEAAALAQEMRVNGPPELAGAAEFAWGTVLAVESAHPLEAEAHLQEAEKLLTPPLAYPSQITPARRKYQLAAVLGQRGKSGEAVAAYRAALALAQADPSTLDITRSIMLHNNLAYHLHLLGDQNAAADAVRAGIDLTREKADTSHLPYLLSTSGEIALAQGDFDAAEKYLNEGLATATALPLPERVAGILANLGLVAKARGQTDRARQQLSDALGRADAIGIGHLAVRIRIWLAPLLAAEEGQARLREARAIAEANGYAGLLEEIERLEQDVPR